jgi:hypothetical protein
VCSSSVITLQQYVDNMLSRGLVDGVVNVLDPDDMKDRGRTVHDDAHSELGLIMHHV